MVGSYANGGAAAAAAAAVASGEKLDELRRLLGKSDGDPLRLVGVGAGAWGSVFCALLQDAYGRHRDRVQVRVWRRPGRAVDRADAERLFEVINAREDVLRRLIRRCAYLKYVEARLGDRTLHADEILRDGFCLNMLDTPLCPLKVVTNLQEAVWDADIVVNGLPSTETREVFGEIGRYWKERISQPLIISLAKGIEASLDPVPRIITPTQMISNATGVPMENILYLGGPNIASEIYNKEYANARICGADKWRKPLAKFLRQPHFIGVSAVNAFYELLSQGSLCVMHPETKKPVAPVELCPILKTLYKILIKRDLPTNSILQAIRDESMYDPRERIEMAQRQSLFRPSLLGLPNGDAKA
ncbi:putative glycerol-3-phosphate dehydrogenase [NAD(+)] 2, cytosolic [Dichanthelium oligosanthes]|uniref:Putative glycerol-3-phosphate dehydrogenase [NAD(+)] 2, cytosolic n=1 Tax=Dichanthelium oligosanthes TaxID=888268 RepID=A0A1E5WK55_9POAL|nr:putative glycerol-3-phosphate dehydrogenase [NAD(+)] 2, cytosolic [Dichanthelium oligosanthes]